MSVKSVAQISVELAEHIADTIPEGGDSFFNPVTDANGNTVISLGTAQYLMPNLYKSIPWVPQDNQTEL